MIESRGTNFPTDQYGKKAGSEAIKTHKKLFRNSHSL